MDGLGSAKNSMKRGLIRLVALPFVIYALADVTILQAYCGNEAIGIPPDHHMSDSGRHLDRSDDSPCSAEQADCQQVPRDHEYDHQHHCFAWHLVVVAFHGFELGSTDKLSKAKLPLFHQDVHSDSALSHLFRPPRTA